MTGPGAAGVLIKLTGALACSHCGCHTVVGIGLDIARRVQSRENPGAGEGHFGPPREGIDFVRGHKLLVTMAACVGAWQMCNEVAS